MKGQKLTLAHNRQQVVNRRYQGYCCCLRFLQYGGGGREGAGKVGNKEAKKHI